MHTLSNLHTGGAARLLLQNITAIGQERVNNSVCYFTPKHDLLDQYMQIGVTPTYLGHTGRLQTARTFWRFIKLLRNLNIDVIHANHPIDKSYAIIAGRILSIPVVMTIHDTYPRSLAAKGGGKFRVVGMSLLERLGVERYVAVSKAVEKLHSTEYKRPIRKFTVVYSGLTNPSRYIDNTDDDPAAIKTALGIADKWPVIINVGRLQSVKGQVHLARMMPAVVAKWPGAHVLIAGEGPERQALEKAIAAEKMEQHITLLGDRTDVLELLKASDLFVFPSLREALPMAVIEAMAVGLPVVASNTGGLPELVRKGENGLIVEPGDADGLAEAIISILDTEDRGRSIGLRGQERVLSEFDATRVADQLVSIYREAVGWDAAD